MMTGWDPRRAVLDNGACIDCTTDSVTVRHDAGGCPRFREQATTCVVCGRPAAWTTVRVCPGKSCRSTFLLGDAEGVAAEDGPS